ncbi:sulfatase [Polaribacter filamentus]|uniref:Sulfatase n=2 Tax=Polaribacter filamentus TaxID=53483 RepID=A0A2S7L288_9FLAO|nr:sulfatase [Polaribacter filamentus]
MSCNLFKTKEKFEKRPNVILFLVDDLGWQDTSVPFWIDTTRNNKVYQTPNMERLASKGMKFTQAYAHSVCSPSRVSLMTGMNPARHRVTNWTLEENTKRDVELRHPTLVFPDWNVNGISPQKGIANSIYAKALPKILSDNGYRTIHCGKAHFGAIGTLAENPTNIGFDVNIAGHAAGAPASYFGEDSFGTEKNKIWGVPGLEKYHHTETHLSEALTLEAISAMNQSLDDKQPFFLYMSHYAVHTPLQGDSRFVDKYIQTGMDDIEANYASMIEGVDKSLGDLLLFLEEKQIVNNTIILLMSDNGGLCNTPPRGGIPFKHNAPLSSGKSSAREGGIRVPMIVSWPGQIKMNTTNDAQLIIEDFFPTILSIGQCESFEIPQVVDGESFLRYLKDPLADNQQRELIWHYPNDNGNPEGHGFGAYSAIRKGDWKLIYYHKDSSFELFNLKNDIGESNNLINSEPQLATELAGRLSDYLIKVEAQMPRRKKDQKLVAWPKETLAI